ncbi:far upstream element-binding protein 1-like [Papaver somniferum]|uniref:far upstream element-binding protein 1-like n=1 Tax=Papaver somniferum TaxID=3469 RepID=UPI000E6F53DF|nr:far upstream element-binding protein 1-like [Papaver somniferum]
MAEDSQYSTRTTTDNNKRKHEDYHDRSPPSYSSRRPSGFSAPIIDSTQQNPNNSYNPSPNDEIQQAKQKAQEIAARIFNSAEAKRPRFENGDGYNDEPNDYGQKQQPQQMPIYGSGMNMASSAVPTSYGSSQGGSKKIEIPNGKVGVIIGRGGDKIKNLQLMSGAKIQITRDMEADRNAPMRGVELMGTPDQIDRAEQLINEALAEVDTDGGSGAVPRRFTGQPGVVQYQMKVANNKVGLVIGKGGDTIKQMQASSGARIQVIPLHPPPGDTSTERTVYIDGTPEQIEYAKQLVNEVISENRVRNPPMGGGYPPQQGYRPQQGWAPPGAPPMQQTSYGYVQQPGAYPTQAPQGSSGTSYPGYPTQPTSGGYPSGWDQTSGQTNPQGSGTGYDYYSQQPQGGASTATDTAGYGYGYGQTATYGQQHGGSYGDSGYAQPPAGQQSYTDMYGVYHPPAPQPGYGYGGSQGGYDQSQQSYGSSAKGPTEVPPPTSQVAPVQPPTSAGIGSQQPNAPPSYPPQGSVQTSYGGQPTPPPMAQAGYGPPQGQKAAYGQTPPPSSTQTSSVQSAPVQSGYGLPPPQSGYSQPDSAQYRTPSGYGSAPGYGLAPPYGAPQPAAQPGYGQVPPYGASQPGTQPGYGQSYESKVPSYSSDSNVGAAAQKSNSNDTTPASQSGQQTGAEKASPKS